jgi:hypothetical protein
MIGMQTTKKTTTGMIMGAEEDDDGDNPPGQTPGPRSVDRVGMDLEEITAAVVQQLMEKSGSNSIQKMTGMQMKGMQQKKKKTTTGNTMGFDGQTPGVDTASVGLDLEEITTAVVQQLMKKSRSNSNKKMIGMQTTKKTTTGITGIKGIT